MVSINIIIDPVESSHQASSSARDASRKKVLYSIDISAYGYSIHDFIILSRAIDIKSYDITNLL